MTDIRALYTELAARTHLPPNERTNQIISELTAFALSDECCPHNLAPHELGHLQRLCSKCEYEFECAWAEALILAENPWKMMATFPDIQHYRDLTTLGWNTLRLCCGHDHGTVLFCGSGPLPLTAILLATQHGAQVTCLELSPDAVQLSRKVIAALKLEGSITIEEGDAMQYDKFNQFEIIAVAALVGAEQEEAVKAAIFKRIKTLARPKTHILARSTWGNRSLLYRPLPQSVYQDLRLLAEVHPQGDVVNSIVVFNT